MASLDKLVDDLERSYAELQERMGDPAVYADRREAAELGRRLKELEPAIAAARAWRQVSSDLADAKADPELSSIVDELAGEADRLEGELKLALVERDPADDKDVIVEVRQGVGGDEAALWAEELARMLQRYADRRGYRTETLSASENDGGGVKEAVFAVKGDGAYSVFKWEGGTHRVQRVPATESQGRIHTSTATVAVMPEAEEVEVEIEEKDLKIDVYRSTGPGGQSVNTTDSRVELALDVAATTALDPVLRARALQRLEDRLVDGVLTVTAAEERSQLANRRLARARLTATLRAAVAAPPRPRRPTAPTRGSVTRRLESKRRRAETKRARRPPDE